jgi:hypothetical protein
MSDDVEQFEQTPGLISFESLHDAISPGNRYSDEVAIPDDSISRVGNLPGSICRNRRAFRKSNVEDPVTSTLPSLSAIMRLPHGTWRRLADEYLR